MYFGLAQGGRFHRRGTGYVTDSGPARVIATQFRQLILVGFPWRSGRNVDCRVALNRYLESCLELKADRQPAVECSASILRHDSYLSVLLFGTCGCLSHRAFTRLQAARVSSPPSPFVADLAPIRAWHSRCTLRRHVRVEAVFRRGVRGWSRWSQTSGLVGGCHRHDLCRYGLWQFR